MKWHYFNEYDPVCYIEPWVSPQFSSEKKCYYTACGMPASTVKKYTEDKRQVDCLKCLKRLNKSED